MWRKGARGAGVATGPRETENARAYNLKTHSAFKLLTMAAGYKVLCRCRDAEESAWERGEEEERGRIGAIQKFDLFARRLRTARRRDSGQIGGRF